MTTAAEPREAACRKTLRERAYPEALRERELQLRGKCLKVGLGLSGGGIRSATFCLGVLQALAKVNALSRVDVISTVSGGGYVGGMLTRLFARKAEGTPGGSSDAESNDTRKPRLAPDAVLRWLRENGRYLAPKRAGDSLLAATVVLRNWLSLHVVLGSLVLGLFLAMQAPRPLISQANLWPSCLVEVLPFADRVCWSPWWVISLPVGVLAVLLALVRWLGGGRRLSKRQQRVHRLSVALRNVLRRRALSATRRELRAPAKSLLSSCHRSALPTCAIHYSTGVPLCRVRWQSSGA